jgi:hypothetical protein
VLVGEAVLRRAVRQVEELRAHTAGAPAGRARAEVALDAIFEQYSGSLFAAMVELALAARSDAGLAPIVAEQERLLSQAVQEIATEAFGAEHAATAVSAARGLAMLRLFGYPDDAVARQWRRTRADVLRLLS